MQIAAANRRNQILGQCWQLKNDIDSYRDRRNQILGQCWQLKNDIDSYNDRRCPNEPIQMDFNFNVDLEELAQENEAA
jgi:hypothetical protein